MIGKIQLSAALINMADSSRYYFGVILPIFLMNIYFEAEKVREIDDGWK